jgi:hypothetical protein
MRGDRETNLKVYPPAVIDMPGDKRCRHRRARWVDRSVKVRRDSRKRSQLILANIGHFLFPLRGYGTVQPDITRRPRENGIFR